MMRGRRETEMNERLMTSNDGGSAPPSLESEAVRVLDLIEPARSDRSVLLASGRRLDVHGSGECDRIEIRGRHGEVVLRIRVDDAGPVLSFEGAHVEIAASERLTLTGQDVDIRASRSLAVVVEGDVRSEIGGARHTTIRGAERLEAESLELQANEADVAIRARDKIRIDGEGIGLNDAALPAPFSWSRPALDADKEEGEP